MTAALLRTGRPLAGGALLLAVAALAGCGSSGSPASATDGVPTARSAAPPVVVSAAPVGQAYPLTGAPAPDAGATTRPVVAVAVQTGTGLPAATGVADADVVFTSFPSSGRQRALALFQSRDSTRVGPVADTRPLDSKLLVALDAVLMNGGGTSGFVKQVGAADLAEWSAVVHPDTFARDTAGQIYGSTTIARTATGVQPARFGLLTFGAAPAAPAAPPPPVRLAVSGQSAVTLTWDAASSTWGGTVGGLALRATNVVVQQVTYDALVLPKTGGRTEGNPDTEGSGATTVLSGPTVRPGTWNRGGRGTNIKYLDADTNPVLLTPGTTWVLLVPAGTPVTTS